MNLENFLERLDLKLYRDLYKDVKIVEMDLPRNIWPLKHIYKVYWEEKKQLDFETFFIEYRESVSGEIETFRNKIGMCHDCFYKGLPARIYRTWTALLTQVHAGEIAQDVFGKDSVSMSEQLDFAGIDMQIQYLDNKITVQIKKHTARKEARVATSGKRHSHIHFNIYYRVLRNETRENPLKRNGELKKEFMDFQSEYYSLLSNGFVIFTHKHFEEMRDTIVGR